MEMEKKLTEKYGKSLTKGTVIFYEGEIGHEMYVVQKGKVQITVSAKGKEKILAVLSAGDFFGEMSILNDKPRRATATVIEDADLLVLDRDTFTEMIKNNGEIALRMIKTLARRIDTADGLIEILLHRDPRSRIILALTQLAESSGQESESGVVISISTEELSEQIGVEETMTQELLTRLKKSNMIELLDGDQIIIKDIITLQEYLEYLHLKEKFDEI